MSAPPLEFPEDEYPQMTVEEFDQWVLLRENSEHGYEYIAGKVHDVVARPESSKLGLRMGRRIGNFLDDHDLGHLTGADGGYHVAGERYIPDVWFISYKRRPEAKLVAIHGYVTNAADLAVEVISPTDSHNPYFYGFVGMPARASAVFGKFSDRF
jgi:Uma2 family endonuclease